MRSWYSETYVCLPPLNECLPLLLAGRFDRSSILDDILTVCDVLNINYQVIKYPASTTNYQETKALTTTAL
jgi:hypothetical protein